MRKSHYNAARTNLILGDLPDWIDVDPGTRLHDTINILGTQAEITRWDVDRFRENVFPFHMDLADPVNISKVSGVILPEDLSTLLYRGVKDNFTFPLIRTDTQEQLLGGVPTRLTLQSTVPLDIIVPIYKIRYMRDLEEGTGAFAVLTTEIPIVDKSLRTINMSGLETKQFSFSIATQSFAVTGEDERVEFDGNNQYKLAHFPASGTLKVFDVLNLDSNGVPTDVTSDTSVVNFDVLQWNSGTPTSIYVVEYDYPKYAGLTSIAPIYTVWNVGENRSDTDLSLKFLEQFLYTFESSFGSLVVSSHSQTKDITILSEVPIANGGVITTYFIFDPREVRSGRLITVAFTGTAATEESWVVSSGDYTKQIDGEAGYIDSDVNGVKVFDASDKDITKDFTIDLASGLVTITQNTTYNGQTLSVKIYFHKSFSASYTISNHTTTLTDNLNREMYHTRADVTSLLNQSLDNPVSGTLKVTCAFELISAIELEEQLIINEEAAPTTVYLERHNQSIHFRNTLNETQEEIHLLGMSLNRVTNIFSTNVDVKTVTNQSQVTRVVGRWDYLDFVKRGEQMFVLKTLVDKDSSDYWPPPPPDPDVGESRIAIINIFSKDLEALITIPIDNCRSLTIADEDKLFILSRQGVGTASENNIIYEYRVNYDYILFSRQADDTHTAFSRTQIDTLTVELI